MSSERNNFIPDYSALAKKSIPTFDMSPIIESLSILAESLKKSTANLSVLNNQSQHFQQSIQPLIDNLNFINQGLASKLNESTSKITKNSLITLNSISQYSFEDIEKIDKNLFVSVVNELSNIDDNNDFESYSNNLSTINPQLNDGSNNQLSIHTWITTICAILGLLISIFSSLNTSSERAQIENQKQIIEYQAAQLKKLESIDNSLQKLIQTDD